MLVSGLSACSLSGFEAMFCVAWVGADAVGRCSVLLRVLLARTSVPTAIASPHSKQTGALYLPVIDLAPRGEGGMVAYAEDAESSTSSASSDRPSAVLPIVSPPRGLLAWVSWKENLLSKFSVLFIYTPVWPWPVIRISNSIP